MAKGKKPLVVVTRKLPDTVETRMRELFDTRLNVNDKRLFPVCHVFDPNAPIPKFACTRGTSDANFGIKGALATL